MGQTICSSQSEGPQRTNSIFRDFSDDSALGKRYGWQKEFKIGPYLEQENQKQEQKKVKYWQKLDQEAKNGQSKSKKSNLDLFIVTKNDLMVYDIYKNNPKEFFKQVLKGPPQIFRWSAWKSIFQHNVTFEPSLYERLIENIENDPDYLQIKKDSMRTFPQQYYFNHSQRKGDGVGHQQLDRVLGAIAKYFPESYCQSMNFILGLLLMVSGGNEIDAFWSFVSLVKNQKFLIVGLYESGMPLLNFLEFMTLKVAEKYIPEIIETFDEICVPTGSWLIKWFMTLYTYAFPVKICLRIWDYVLVRGIFGLIYILIPIMKNFENFLLSMDDLEYMEQFQEITKDETKVLNPESEYYMNMDKIIKKADKYQLKPEDIEKYAKEYLDTRNQNDYVELFLSYSDKQKFQKEAQHFMSLKIYTHPSKQASQQNTLILDERSSSKIESDYNYNLTNNNYENSTLTQSQTLMTESDILNQQKQNQIKKDQLKQIQQRESEKQSSQNKLEEDNLNEQQYYKQNQDQEKNDELKQNVNTDSNDESLEK